MDDGLAVRSLGHSHVQRITRAFWPSVPLIRRRQVDFDAAEILKHHGVRSGTLADFALFSGTKETSLS